MTWTPQEIPNDGDWRSRGLKKVPTEDECATVRLPFKIYPELVDCYSAKFTINLRHLVTGQKSGTPWTGYYATFKGAKLAVSNMFGAWFEIERRNDKWQVVRLAHTELKLQGLTLPGLNIRALIETGEPTNAELIERARLESRASQHSYGVRRHFPTSQLAEIYFCYSSLKSHSIFMKLSAVVSH